MKEHKARLELASFLGGCFGRMMLENLLLKNLVSKLNAHTTSGSCQVTDIYEDSGGIQFK